MRLQKFLSLAGLASRREAEDWIKARHIKVNGRLAEIGSSVDSDIDIVTAFGKTVVAPKGLLYIAMNKPKGYVVSKHDPYGRKTVFSLIDEKLREQVWNVGRLDYETEGLLLFSNDGTLTQKLTHPSFEHEKEYEVKVDQPPTKDQKEFLKENSDNATFRGSMVYLTIHEGKKHQVRRLVNSAGLAVLNLKRIRIGNLKLGNIPLGKYISIKNTDLL